jgi:DNA processing protein
VSSPVSEGTNRLIQDGAKLVRSWEDVVAEWPAEWRRALRPAPVPAASRAPLLDGPNGRLLDLLGEEPTSIDTVIAGSGLPASEVAASLMALQLMGRVRQLPGQRYVRC